MKRDALGDRMKHNYEEVSKTRLTRRMPVIIRLDGKAFHTFTKGLEKPFDRIFTLVMQETMKYLCENIQGCVFGYTQSDEITLVLIDYQTLQTGAWYDYEVQKMVSVSASMATLAFNKAIYELLNNKSMKINDDIAKLWESKLFKGTFDSRVFNIPKEEVTNCIFWRQLDAERNSINSLAQSLFNHKELNGLSCGDLLIKMDREKNVIWGNLPTHLKRGSACYKVMGEWVVDLEMPQLKDSRRVYVDSLIGVGDD